MSPITKTVKKLLSKIIERPAVFYINNYLFINNHIQSRHYVHRSSYSTKIAWSRIK